jgi:hypothetical protein
LTPEGLIKTAILRYLERRGFFAWNNTTGAVQIRPGKFLRFGKVGSSDIIGILPDGRFLAVETKAPAGRLSAEQKIFMEKVQGEGGLATIARSWQELDTILRQEGYTVDGSLFDCKKNDQKETVSETAWITAWKR